MRSKHYYQGIYYTLGPHDVWPMDTEIFGGQSSTPAAKKAESVSILKSIDEAINKKSAGPPDSVPLDMFYTSLESNEREQFKKFGYYSHKDVIYA